MKHSIALVKSRPLLWPYLFLWISVMAGAVWIQWTDSLVFARFFGDVKPLPVYMLAGVLGFGALRYLDRTFDLQLLSRHSTKSYSIPVLGATVFGCSILSPEGVPAKRACHPVLPFHINIWGTHLPWTCHAAIRFVQSVGGSAHRSSYSFFQPVSIMDLQTTGFPAHVFGPHILLHDLAYGVGIFQTAAMIVLLTPINQSK